MSQPACEKYACELKEGGLLLYESSLVDAKRLPSHAKKFGIDATHIAEQMGKRMVLNIVMMGFFTSLAGGLVSKDAVSKAIADLVPPGTAKLNQDAFLRGFEAGEKAKSTI